MTTPTTEMTADDSVRSFGSLVDATGAVLGVMRGRT